MIREMVHYGSFYPASNLERMIAKMTSFEKKYKPVAMIVPHAGYTYSGIVAGQAYAQIVGEKYENIFLLGPSHHEYLNKPCISEFTEFETPFGLLNVNGNVIKDLQNKKLVEVNNNAHEQEHSLEVQLPFIAHNFKDAKITPKIVPILLNNPDFNLAEYFSSYVNNSLFVISSDLSHYLPAKTAEEKDKKTIDLILKRNDLDSKKLDACGSAAIETITRFAKLNKLKPNLLEYMHSGYASKDFSSVVGYVSIIYTR